MIATLNPNHTYEKVVFDPWQQTTWDVNDTSIQEDPKADPDVGDFFRRLPDEDYLPTWYRQRITGVLGEHEMTAAEKAAVHADTPTCAHFDTLGRTFLTETHNRFERDESLVEERYVTRVHFGIEGNQREVIDAKGRIVMRYDYDMLGDRIHHASMEAGERWTFGDVAGSPLRAWDSRGHTFRTVYDSLRRPVESYVQNADVPHLETETLYQKTDYGEGRTDDTQLNLRGQVYRQYDGAGLVANHAYDYKGNLLTSSRRLAVDYESPPNWSAAVELEQETFSSSTTYDALNRPITVTAPDNSLLRPTYNEANLLDKLEANLRGADIVTTFVENIDYDAKGRRTSITYGNGTHTRYTYDPETFRLTHLFTSRGPDFPDDCPEPPPDGWPGCNLQSLYYTYDPAGNITHIHDHAQQLIFFRNQRVEPSNDYTYDAIYRLIEAKGREHIGQAGRPWTSWNDEGRVRLEHPHDGQAMRRYTERYVYDEVGNFLSMIHHAHRGDWIRSYVYEEPSLIEPGQQNNRLSRTIVNGDTERYTHDEHGNMTSMPHLAQMDWDFSDQLQRVDLEGGGTAYYVYDASGQRVRKVIDRRNSARRQERIYIGGFEMYREHNGNGDDITLERETLHIMDDQQRIALVETRTRGHDNSPEQLVRYQLSNHLGSASLELDNEARIVSYEEYYPYGSTSYQTDWNHTETPKRYRYTGMERDEETGLNYHTARYYVVWLGRWISSDPVGLVYSDNLYLFCNDNCVNRLDPSGSIDSPSLETSVNEVLGQSRPVTDYRERIRLALHDPVTADLLEAAGLFQNPLTTQIDHSETGPRRPASASRAASQSGEAYPYVAEQAIAWAHEFTDYYPQEYGEDPGRVFIMLELELARESGGTFAAPVPATSPGTRRRSSGWGVFQIEPGTWRSALGVGTHPAHASAFDEIALPMRRIHARIYEQYLSEGAAPDMAARAVMLWHAGVGHLNTWRRSAQAQQARNTDMSWDKALRRAWVTQRTMSGVRPGVRQTQIIEGRLYHAGIIERRNDALVAFPPSSLWFMSGPDRQQQRDMARRYTDQFASERARIGD